MARKTCRDCKAGLMLGAFGRDSRSADKLKGICKACECARLAKWRSENKEKFNAQQRERALVFYYANHETEKAKRSEVSRRRRAANPGPGRRLARPGAKAETVAWRRAILKNATPAWAERAAIRAVYRAAKETDARTGKRHHVDHIVPLVSPLVCGLHVPANLQVLPYLENHSKSNKRWPDMPTFEDGA